MKFRQKFAAILAALMLATSLPTFAASTNGVNKIITVAKGTELKDTIAPELKIEFKDKLAKGQTFYLDLENAEWALDAADQLNAETLLNTNFEFTLEDSKQIGVKAKEAVAANSEAYRIPMFAKVTGGDAAVTIDSNDTVVTAGKYVFAVSNTGTSMVTVADAKSFATIGSMADITVEEAHIGAFQNADKDLKVIVELDTKGITFSASKGVEIAGALVGQKAYLGKNYAAKVIDATTLEVTIPKGSLTGTQRGSFTIKDMELKVNKEASYGEINATISGDLNETTQLLVAKYGDYGTDLTVAKEYTATAGQELKDVEFTLSETVADSLSGNGEIEFAFSEGVTIKEVTVSKTAGILGTTKPTASVEKKDDKNTNKFTVRSIATDSKAKTAVTFIATLNVPASFTGDINLIVEGRYLEDVKEVEVAKVTAPVEVKVTPATVKVGLAKQEGGKVLIKETDKGMLSAGKIFLAIEDADFNYTKAPEVKVLEGNLKVDAKAVVTRGGIEITVNSKSTKASTLEISGGEMSINGMVPEGTYAVKVGGSAISAYSSKELWNVDKKEYNDIDEIAEKDFIYVGTKNATSIVSFVIGQSTYTKNGVEMAMDTAAYISQGRTMLPVRYVSDALGIDGKDILWDKETKTVTILAERIVQIKVGNKEMIINGAKVPMTAMAEVKNDRVFIPVAEIARALSANVEWDNTTKTATFN